MSAGETQPPSGPIATRGTGAISELPFIDEHLRAVEAPGEQAWEQTAQVMRRWVEHTFPRLGLAGAVAPPLARLLRCSDVTPPPPGAGAPEATIGFHMATAEPPSLIVLCGEHRFSRYALTFKIEPAGGSRCTVAAETRAAFPGRAGRIYRSAIVGTGAHARVVNRLLDSIKHRAERRQAETSARRSA